MSGIPYSHPAWIEIDLKQFQENIRIIKNFVGSNVKLLLPIKSNAYGHGLIDIAKAAAEVQADYLGVSCLQEGILLRQANINMPILVLGAIHQEQIKDLIEYDIEFTIASMFKAKLVSTLCKKLGKVAKVHIEIDTGMHRTGVRLETAKDLLDFIQQDNSFELKGVYSHLALADEKEHPFTQKQIDDFITFITRENLINNPNIICHIANSAGMAFYTDSHLDMVRPGILTFGYPPRDEMPKELQDIKPCLSIKAKISYFKTVMSGSGISYNHRHVTSSQTRVVTVPLGYGDGLRRDLSNKGHVILNDKRYPIIGTICMDQFMVDIGDDSAHVGDVVTIIGKEQTEELRIIDHAKLCDTITYEILCGFNNRLPRVYKA